MKSLQQIIYEQLPRSTKETIMANGVTYPEYNEVISRINKDFLSNFKTKVNLTKKEIILASILLSIYYHIKNHPPELFIQKKNKKDINPSIEAWFDFINNNYSFYNDVEDNIEYWPKFMFLLYHTYNISYKAFYNLRSSPFIINIPKFNRKTTKFITFIFNTYKYLDNNLTLKILRDWGY